MENKIHNEDDTSRNTEVPPGITIDQEETSSTSARYKTFKLNTGENMNYLECTIVFFKTQIFLFFFLYKRVTVATDLM